MVNKMKKSIFIIWIPIFVFSYTIMAFFNTMIPVYNFSALSLYLMRDVLVILSIIGILLNYIAEKDYVFKRDLPILTIKITILIIVYYLAYIQSSNQESMTVWLMILFVITADVWEEDSLLKIGFVIGTLVVVVAFFLSMTGVIENNRGNSFGFTYRTHYACFLLCMALVWCIIKDGFLTWVGELGLLALSVYVGFIVGGKTAFVCLIILDTGVLWRHFRINKGVPFQKYGFMIKWLFAAVYLPIRGLDWFAEKAGVARMKEFTARIMKWSFLICCAFFMVLVFTYPIVQPIWKMLPGVATVEARLYYSYLGLLEYPLTLFGNSVTQIGASGTETYHSLYYVFDTAYVKLIVQFGLVLFSLLLCFMTIVQFRLYKRGRYFTMFVISLFAVDNMMEYQMVNMSYNLFILLTFSKLSVKPGIEACDKWSLEKLSSMKRWTLGIAVVFLIMICSLWSVTAYNITSWRGWTPDYDATVVIPGHYIDSIEGLSKARLERARGYLVTHTDSVCIAEKEDRAWLIEHGIDKERVFSYKANSIYEMLDNADSLIKENGLPSRLTVCTYEIEQERITRRAEIMHIPVNSLTMKVPSDLHLKAFTAEQWRILWEEK